MSKPHFPAIAEIRMNLANSDLLADTASIFDPDAEAFGDELPHGSALREILYREEGLTIPEGA